MKKVLAIKKKMNNPRSVYNLWNDLNVDEIWCYFSILMDITHKPYYRRKESLLSTPIFLTMMRRDRFEYTDLNILRNAPFCSSPCGRSWQTVM